MRGKMKGIGKENCLLFGSAYNIAITYLTRNSAKTSGVFPVVMPP
jgi:hypothetical protein